MKTALLTLLLINISCTDTATVYICDSKNATKYHYSPTCRGLANCSYKIVKITLEEAKKRGKTLCKWEK
jgi:5-bromo-4-chloroindolyl phosphate hydrolysis protein